MAIGVPKRHAVLLKLSKFWVPFILNVMWLWRGCWWLNAMIASCSGGPPLRIEDRLVVRVSRGALTLPWGLRDLEKVMPLQRRAAPPRNDIAWNTSPNVWHWVRHGLSLAAAVTPLLVDGRLSNGDSSCGGSRVPSADGSEL